MFKDYINGKKAVCFDLDGTIVDSLPLWETAVRNTLKKITTLEDLDLFGIYKGRHLYEVYSEIIKDHGIETDATLGQLAQETKTQFLNLLENVKNLEPRDGFWKLAKELKKDKGLKLALVSNSDRQIVNKITDKMEITKVFDVSVAGDEVRNRKPHPEMYQIAAKKLGITPSEMLVFEDSPAGAQAANKAGADIIIIWNAEIREAEYPGKTLNFLPDFSALPGYLDLDYVEYIKKMADEEDPYAKPRI